MTKSKREWSRWVEQAKRTDEKKKPYLSPDSEKVRIRREIEDHQATRENDNYMDSY